MLAFLRHKRELGRTEDLWNRCQPMLDQVLDAKHCELWEVFYVGIYVYIAIHCNSYSDDY